MMSDPAWAEAHSQWRALYVRLHVDLCRVTASGCPRSMSFC